MLHLSNTFLAWKKSDVFCWNIASISSNVNRSCSGSRTAAHSSHLPATFWAARTSSFGSVLLSALVDTSGTAFASADSGGSTSVLPSVRRDLLPTFYHLNNRQRLTEYTFSNHCLMFQAKVKVDERKSSNFNATTKYGFRSPTGTTINIRRSLWPPIYQMIMFLTYPNIATVLDCMPRPAMSNWRVTVVYA